MIRCADSFFQGSDACFSAETTYSLATARPRLLFPRKLRTRRVGAAVHRRHPVFVQVRTFGAAAAHRLARPVERGAAFRLHLGAPYALGAAHAGAAGRRSPGPRSATAYFVSAIVSR